MKANTMVDLAQTIIAITALLSVYNIIPQRREMALSSQLNAATTLFDYYTLAEWRTFSFNVGMVD